jgi:hypothetical protein
MTVIQDGRRHGRPGRGAVVSLTATTEPGLPSLGRNLGTSETGIVIDRAHASPLGLILSSVLTLTACFDSTASTDAPTPWLRVGASPGVVKSDSDIVSPTITYTKAASPVKTWPWKVKTITVVCDVLPSRGVHTTPIDGVQYALFGGYAVIIEYLRYARGSQLQYDPDDRDATDSFNSIVKEDCEIYARVWDEDVD